jgi:hypothetical protein
MVEEEVLQSELFKHGNISLILDSYNDIFSSFDPRPYNEKALSDDFLIECKRAARDKDDSGFELILSVPKAKRNVNDEFKIKKRLREHFHKHSIEEERVINKTKREGFIWVLIGSLLIFGIGIGLINIENLVIQSLLALFEIPGWFLVWEGMGKIFIDTRKLEPDYLFYKKMATSEILFRSY